MHCELQLQGSFFFILLVVLFSLFLSERIFFVLILERERERDEEERDLVW
jgi:hypothetical protein